MIMTRTSLNGLAAAAWSLRRVLGAQGAVPEIAFDSNADLLRTPGDVFVGEVGGVGRELERPDLRLHPHRPSLRHARRQPHLLPRRLQAVPVRRQRQVRPRTGPGRLRLQRRLRPAHRSAGQRLDHRRGANQVVKFDTEGPGRAGARPQARDDRRAARAARPAARRRRRWRWRWRRRSRPRPTGGPVTGVPGSTFSQPDRRGVGPRRQHLHRRRHRHQQPHRQVRQGRPVHRPLGLHRIGPWPVQRREGASPSTRQGDVYVADVGQQARSRCSTPTARSSASSPTSARRWRCA